MLKIIKYSPVCVCHLNTPGFSVTGPLVSEGLCSGLRFSEGQFRTQVCWSQHALRGLLCPLSWLASTCHPSSIHSFTTCLGPAQQEVWLLLDGLQCMGYFGAIAMRSAHYQTGKRHWWGPILNLSQRQMKTDIWTILFLSQRTKCQVLCKERGQEACWWNSPVCAHPSALSEIVFLVSWLRQSSI